METAIGVFSLRDRAEEAVRELLSHGVLESEIVYLTRSETNATESGKQFGTAVGGIAGGALGMSAGVIAATLLLPGIGPVFALGFGAAALLGLMGAGAGGVLGTAVVGDQPLSPTADEKCSDDAQFFRGVLREGRSVVVVRTDSAETARTASGVLDRLGIGIHGRTPVAMQISIRIKEDISIVDLGGRITSGEGNVVLRDVVRDLLTGGSNKILLNLHEVGYVDSSGLGELVKAHTSVRNNGGQLKIVNPSKRVNDLLHITMLHTAFDIQPDEASAIQSFGDTGASKAVA